MIGCTKWIVEYFSYLALVEYRTKWIRIKWGPSVAMKNSVKCCKDFFFLFQYSKNQLWLSKDLKKNSTWQCWWNLIKWLKFSFSEKAKEMCSICLMVWHLISKHQNHKACSVNSCGLLRKVELSGGFTCNVFFFSIFVIKTKI